MIIKSVEIWTVVVPTIPGRVPLAGSWPQGCHFASRCAFAREECVGASIPFVDGVRCVRSDELALEGVGS